MQASKQRLKERQESAAHLHLPSAQTNKHMAVLSYDRQDFATAQALTELSVWSDSVLEQPGKSFHPGKLNTIIEAGVFKSLLAVQSTDNSQQPFR